MSTTDLPQPPPSPLTHSATKQAVSTNVDPPHHDDTSPMPPRPLFDAATPPEPQELFSGSSEDEGESPDLLLRRPLKDALPSITPTQHSLDIEVGDADDFESPSKRQKTGFSPSQSSMPSSRSTPAIRRVGDIPQRYYDCEDVDSEFEEDDIFEIDEEIRRGTDAHFNRLQANKKAMLHNNILHWARTDAISSQPPIAAHDKKFRQFELAFSRQIHHRFNETRQSSSDTDLQHEGIFTRRSSSLTTLDESDGDDDDLASDNHSLSRYCCNAE